jgi:hypothetical protein
MPFGQPAARRRAGKALIALQLAALSGNIAGTGSRAALTSMNTFLGPPRYSPDSPDGKGAEKGLARHLCQVTGLNQNHSSRVGTPYHIQIEDRGPLLDAVSEQWVRRINVIVYANYGEPNARIVHGRDHDFADVRSQEHNRRIEQEIQELAVQARDVVEEREERQVRRVKALLREYHDTKSEQAKREFEEMNALYPFVFSRAFCELRQEKGRGGPAPETVAPAVVPMTVDPEPEVLEEVEMVYPLDATMRELVLEIERVAFELKEDVQQLKVRGKADDILLQTCSKLLGRARENLKQRESADFAARRLELTRNSLVTAWRQVRALLLRA